MREAARCACRRAAPPLGDRRGRVRGRVCRRGGLETARDFTHCWYFILFYGLLLIICIGRSSMANLSRTRLCGRHERERRPGGCASFYALLLIVCILRIVVDYMSRRVCGRQARERRLTLPPTPSPPPLDGDLIIGPDTERRSIGGGRKREHEGVCAGEAAWRPPAPDFVRCCRLCALLLIMCPVFDCVCIAIDCALSAIPARPLRPPQAQRGAAPCDYTALYTLSR